ncbi:GntR family transcriptional regulator [Vibrio cyclitrophicus]|uniref:GntR family transcriptional regulator n=1 Tax=Vibrio TaxID=662 RepID=UPI00067F0C3D|nr:GntR family transcriptional regulator [Vibrio cyclitrophicus]KAA8597638.1 Transcriptional regulator GntR family [Vibrio cyclitrophicus]KNH11939.1 GntR family transcriptional regulator [Vibrio lentus]PMH40917.1 GntR family transcriptional regulator [Vibrio cyclitrophicus]PMH77504.1 GntR family transcriptional regulator [Vibrio cyclitrophicus]
MKQDLLKDVIYRRIREMIIVGTLPMGMKISETVLANKLNATKAPIRDALKRLQSEGLVQIKPKSGTFVFHVTAEEFTDLLEFRYFIESEGLKLAWKNNPKQLIQELCFILDKMQVCLSNASTLEYLTLDNQFHQTFISLCDNRYFVESYALISARMATARNHLGGNEKHLYRSYEQHHSIVRALQDDNINDATYQLICHILPKHGAYWGNIHLS